ncbi:replication initiator protein A [Thalassobaculum litoreum]|uniref:Replication initiator protein A n=1 Tax=Thalassobaculum litoreum DSM 18839 TaxID=1123362 RepID=A0A8G2BP48_9PROT|nr:replication initiator protein A [Thalassobaculum litoreum]SDG56536.1 Replication initiator protein A [Thalassobaculum litoreum DSM 18839]
MSKQTAQLPLKLDGPLVGAIKGERNIMAYPFFDLDKRALKARIEFEDPDLGVKIAVRAADGSGVPTIYDKDLVLYVATVLAQRMDEGRLTGSDEDRVINFTVHDFLRVAGRSTDARSYDRFKAMLDRLTSATISTNIEVTVDDETLGADGWFEWFERTGTGIRYRTGKNGLKRISHVRITVGKWLFNAIVKDRKILTYAKAYFDLEPIPRRLYDLARVHVGAQDRWQVRLPKLQARIGDHSRISQFLSGLQKLETEDRLPEYRFRIVEQVRPGRIRRSAKDFERIMVVFTRRTGTDDRQTVTADPGAQRVVDLPAREAPHPRLAAELKSIGYMGRLTRVRSLVERLNNAGEAIPEGKAAVKLNERALCDDIHALAQALVDAGIEHSR